MLGFHHMGVDLVVLVELESPLGLAFQELAFQELAFQELVFQELAFQELVFLELVFPALVFQELVFQALVFPARVLVVLALGRNIAHQIGYKMTQMKLLQLYIVAGFRLQRRFEDG